jgi:dihydrofolate reductase
MMADSFKNRRGLGPNVLAMRSMVVLDMSMSLDGFIAGPNDELDRVHAWMRGGEPGRGVDVVDELFRTTGAVVMGRRTFDLGDKENGWVAEPPFEVPMFVPAHDIPDRVARDAAPTLTFVTEGADAAIEKAKAAAGDGNVMVCGASTGQQCLKAGHLDEMEIHLVHVLLGDGIRLFEPGFEPVELELARIIESVTHLRFRLGSARA